ncbi:MAG: replicative DNA helicase [Zoogloeaceae bacterium]|jgi:replicative DNA helicase|nr:replicative DNA helicase [Zoogloeaceae bacterium]
MNEPTPFRKSLSARSTPDPAVAQLRLPPHSIEAEQSVLGGLLLDNTVWDRLSDQIADTDFYRDEHRRIFRQISVLLGANQPADVLTVAEALEDSGESAHTGGLAYLGELANNTPSAANIVRYAEIVRERATRRKLVAIADEIAAQALNPMGRDTQELLDDAEARILEIAEKGARSNDSFIHIQPLLTQVMEHMQELSDNDNPDNVTGVRTGFADLDDKMSGLQHDDLIVVAGRPSMGKTAFALNIAEHVAAREGLPVGVFSMEMGGAQLALRMLASSARVDSQKLRTAKLNDDEWDRIASAMNRLYSAPLYIDESGGLNPYELRSRARRLHRAQGSLGLIVIDYIQLMSSARQNENRATEVSEISRAIKSLAKELKVPIIALSQLSRKVEERTDKRPLMSDLRESGAIEQDADVIIMLYRDDYYNKEKSQYPGTAEAIIGKQRNGPTGTVRLAFLGEYTRFENLARSPD